MTKRQLGDEVTSVRVCVSLQEASHAPFFFEALFHLGQCRVPHGDDYEAWRARMREELANGRQLYYLGADLATPG
jgi:hypothetical protein